MDKIEELLTRGVAKIIPSKEGLEKKLRSGKKLNVYLGIDPTATKIHLGHAVPLRKLQAFADLSHNVTFLIGDFTALIGDTSDKDAQRPVLKSSQIEENFKTYKKQAEKVLDFSKIRVRYNSEWLSKLTFEEVVKLSQQFSFGDFAARELIKKRLSGGKHVGLHEGLYPAMQGYDSYFMNTDIQIGGTDQTFNMQAGRTLIKNWRKKESFILANGFLPGTDGRKMSKTWNNAIWLEDNPFDMYAKVMAINDDLIAQYFTLATDMSISAIENIEKELKNSGKPISAKKELAKQIVKELYTGKEAENAQNNFEKTVQKKESPDYMKIHKFNASEKKLTDILVETKLAKSKSDAQRLVEQGGVSIDGIIATDPNKMIELKNEKVIKVRKHRFTK